MGLSFNLAYWRDYAGVSGRRLDAEIAGRMQGDFVGNLEGLLGENWRVPTSTGRAIAACLYERMSDQSLFYHTPLHVLSMLDFGRENGIVLRPWEELAVWFHDAIYEPAAQAGRNEESSALFMRALLRSLVPDDVLDKAEAGILATARYEAENVEAEFEVILDLDLCRFAWDWENHRAASENIGREFVPIFGEERYRAGRKAFLEKMLRRGSLYRSAVFRARFEEAARRNMEKGVAEMND